MNQTQIIDLLHSALLNVIQEKGWKSGLLPIQLEAIPIILEGSDCIIEAQTAGGKTEAEKSGGKVGAVHEFMSFYVIIES